jgi:hypothetical protein
VYFIQTHIRPFLTLCIKFEFDFFDPKAAATVGKGGKIVTANAATFPAVIGTGSAMGSYFLAPPQKERKLVYVACFHSCRFP